MIEIAWNERDQVWEADLGDRIIQYRDKRALEDELDFQDASRSRGRIRTPIDERTPAVCQQAEGKRSAGSDLPHDTGDPDNPCRCMAEKGR